ncbi:putative cytokinetic ring protein SteA [Halalkalibacter okhensis]|uniref:putative cytokinetic ring protein SteA n=1 Tax=Halalkalibacter okhensis TaxID=333138 RepID=UPI00068DA46A|nr:putative cytokinetic ring protein SteA [Halalkalibacter okhensis]
MMNLIKGPIYEHKQTKKLLHYLPKRSIVFLWHEDLDGVAVDGLIEAQVKAVINARTSMTGHYAQHHVRRLLHAGIPVFDIISSCKSETIYQGEEAIIFQDELYVDYQSEPIFVASMSLYTEEMINKKAIQARSNYSSQFDKFVHNTLTYAEKECDWFKQFPIIPASLKAIDQKEVFIVARNTKYEKDIKVVRHAMMKKGAVIIAVDGAADGLLKQKIVPDFIIGDMDSVSEKAITCGAQLICHEHPNGTSPGRDRLNKMGILVDTIRFVGTSEDVAITASYWSGANHLYLIGCRMGMTEFLEKGRAGMGSTWLCRIQAGEKITDLKGIHQLTNLSVFPLWQRKNRVKPSLIETIQQLITDRVGIWKKKEVLRHD